VTPPATSEPRRPLPGWDAWIEIRISLHVELPGQGPAFLEGMRLSVDRYMYDRYAELGELDQWLHHQVLTFVLKHSRVRSVAIELP
jgi:hypothetical protein